MEFLVGLEKMRDVCALDPDKISVSLTSRACLSLAEMRGALGRYVPTDFNAAGLRLRRVLTMIHSAMRAGE